MRNRLIALVLAVVAMFALTGCDQEIPTGGYVMDIPGATLESNRQDPELRKSTLVVDVRSADEFASGHLPESLNIPLDELESRIGELEDHKASAVVLVSTKQDLSKQAAEIFVENMFLDVKLAPGIEEFDYTLVQS